jgi:hypothetical protein
MENNGSVIFTTDECNYIKTFWNTVPTIESGGRHPFFLNGNKININSESSGHINYFDETHELFNFVLNRFKKINVKKFSSAIKITRYNQGDFFLPHKDFQHYENGELSRTIVVQLSDSNDYCGGDLIVENIPQTRNIGEYITIKASQLHEVTQITSGIRYGLVIFLLNDDMNFPKTII